MFGRLFFRINQIYRNGAANLDEDDEEELVWEEEEFTAHTDTPTATQEETNSKEDYEMNADANGAISGKKATSSQTAQSVSSDIGTSTHLSTTNKGAQTTAAPGAPSNVNVNDIVSVNEHMKERVVELEQENRRLLTQEEELYKRIQELEARLAAQAITEAAERGEASSATTTPQSKQSTQKSSVPATTPPTAAYYNTTTPPTAVRSTGKASAAATGVGAKKKASTAKKLFVDSPAVPSATATASATTAAGQDAVEVAPRNESSNSSSVLPPSPPAAAGEAPVAVSMTEMAAVMTAVAVADHMSLSSDESAVVVNRSDANSLDGDERPSTANTTNTATMPGSNAGQHQSKSGAVSSAGVASAGGSAAAGASPAKSTTSSFSSNETAKYLAALDDQEDEEDGWN